MFINTFGETGLQHWIGVCHMFTNTHGHIKINCVCERGREGGCAVWVWSCSMLVCVVLLCSPVLLQVVSVSTVLQVHAYSPIGLFVVVCVMTRYKD